jgi:hypothetical protein
MKHYFPVLLVMLLMSIGVRAFVTQQDKNRPDKQPSHELITEITLERKGCFHGTCPIYEVSFHKDGTATYVGRKYVVRLGQYKGKVYPHQFNRLAKWLELQGYFELQKNYAEGMSDAEESMTSVVRGNIRKTVYTRNTEDPPLELWGINAAIDDVVAHIEWKKEQK